MLRYQGSLKVVCCAALDALRQRGVLYSLLAKRFS